MPRLLPPIYTPPLSELSYFDPSLPEPYIYLTARSLLLFFCSAYRNSPTSIPLYLVPHLPGLLLPRPRTDQVESFIKYGGPEVEQHR